MSPKDLTQAIEEIGNHPATEHVGNYVKSMRQLMPTIRRSASSHEQFVEYMNTYIDEGAQVLRDAGVSEALIQPALTELKAEANQRPN